MRVHPTRRCSRMACVNAGVVLAPVTARTPAFRASELIRGILRRSHAHRPSQCNDTLPRSRPQQLLASLAERPGSVDNGPRVSKADAFRCQRTSINTSCADIPIRESSAQLIGSLLGTFEIAASNNDTEVRGDAKSFGKTATKLAGPANQNLSGHTTELD